MLCYNIFLKIIELISLTENVSKCHIVFHLFIFNCNLTLKKLF